MTKISRSSKFSKFFKIFVFVLNTVLITIAVFSLTSCDHQTEYSTDPNNPNAKGKSTRKFRLRKSDQIWDRVRQNFDINPKNKLPVQQAKVQKYVQEYRGAAETRLSKASPYMYYIVEELEKRDMPGELALLPMIESAFEPHATSHKAAAGLWQFIPSTGRHFGLKQDKWYDGRRDVTASTDAALDYLELLHKQFNNNWMLALAAYNAGEGTIQRAINKNIRKGKSTHFWDLDLPRETKEYVPKLLALAEVVKNAEKHKVSLPPIENKPYFASVNVGKPVDLNKVAKIADVEVSELKRLNAGYHKLHTPPKGPQQLLVPVEKVDEVKKKIDQIPETEPGALANLSKEEPKGSKTKAKQSRKKSSKAKGKVKGSKKSASTKAKSKTAKSEKTSTKTKTSAKAKKSNKGVHAKASSKAKSKPKGKK